MNTDFDILCCKLKKIDEELTFYKNTEDSADILRCEILNELPSEPKEHTLYYINASYLSLNEPYENRIKLVCLEDGIVPSWLKASPCCDSIITNCITYEQLDRELQRHLAEKSNIVHVTNELLNALCHNQGFQAIADYGSLLFGNPVFIWDVSLKAIAVPKTIQVRNKYVLEDMASGYMNPFFLQDTTIKEGIEQMQKCNMPRFSERSSEYDSGNGWGHCPIRINGVTIGYVIVYAENKPVSYYQLDWLRLLAQYASMEFQKNKGSDQIEQNPYEELLKDLIERRVTDQLVILRRLELLNQYVTDYMYVVTIRKKMGDYKLGCSKLERKYLRGLFPGSICTAYKGDFVCLVFAKRDELPLKESLDEFNETLEVNGLQIGVSNVFSDIADVQRYYIQSKKTLEYANRYEQNRNVYCYQDYALLHGIEFCTEHVDLRELCHPGILKLQESYNTGDNELFRTLYLYLFYMKDVNRVTEELHIHRSTLFYRLGKVKNMLNIDFDDGHDVVKLMYSFKLIEYMDNFPPPGGERKKTKRYKK